MSPSMPKQGSVEHLLATIFTFGHGIEIAGPHLDGGAGCLRAIARLQKKGWDIRKQTLSVGPRKRVPVFFIADSRHSGNTAATDGLLVLTISDATLVSF